MSQPQRFRPYDRPDDDAGPDTKTRRINPGEKQANDEPWQDMVGSSSWRAERGRVATNRPSGRIPINQQRMSVWLSNGGWKIIGGIAGVMLLLLVFILVSNPPGDNQTATNPTPPANGAFINPDQNPPPIETVPNTIATLPPADGNPAVPNNPTTAARLAVTGTGTEGLFLRDTPGGNILKTMPEGTQVEKLAEQDTDGVLWFNIREQGGMSGWASAQFLAPAP